MSIDEGQRVQASTTPAEWTETRELPDFDPASSSQRTNTERVSPEWVARLSLCLGQRAGRTRLLRSVHHGPLRIQRTFHPESDGTAHLVVLHPPGGLVSGDRLEVQTTVLPHARALLTTTGATKLYRSRGEGAAQMQTHLRVEAGAHLEYVPQETVVFDGARAGMSTHVELAEDAHFLGWEVTCLGRPACGERFANGWLRLSWSVERAGQLLFVERGKLAGSSALLSAAYGLQNRASFGTLLATHVSASAIREELARLGDSVSVAVTQVSELTIVRALGEDGIAVRSWLERARHLVRDAWQRPRLDPGIWRS